MPAVTADERIPVIVGVGHVTRRPDDLASTTEPADLLAAAVLEATGDAGLGPADRARIDRLEVINLLSWKYADPAGAVAARAGLGAAVAGYGPVGGEQPTLLVARLARQVQEGTVTTGVVVGGEALASRRRWGASGQEPPWSPRGKPPIAHDPLGGLGHAAHAHGLTDPASVYPIIDNAHRAARGWSLAEGQERSGRIWAAMSEVAARTPGAWMPTPRTATEVVTPGPKNRMVAFPYTKLMCAQPMVDQAAAVVVTSVAEARRSGIPEDRWVYLVADAAGRDRTEILERPTYTGSEPVRRVLSDVLASAGLGPDDLDLLELYSCFPVVPVIGLEALGLPADTPTTVAGGLTFYGGPLNAYMACATVAMVRALRRGDGRRGLLHGNGEYLTKHHALILATEPPAGGFLADDPTTRQADLDARERPAVVTSPEGEATVETWTALFDRDGRAARGIIIGRRPDGARFVANTPTDADTLDALTDGTPMVGRSGRVVPADGLARFSFA
jgi:acetyl-CoA C-acetyltransferase